MAALTVQELPANAGELAVTFDAADVAGDTFENDSRVFLIVSFGATPSGNVVVEGVPAADSGRDGTTTLTAVADTIVMAGPFKSRNWNNSGSVEVTYPSGVTNISVAAVRYNNP